MMTCERMVRMKLQWKRRFAGQMWESCLMGFERDISMKRAPMPIPWIVYWKSLAFTPSMYMADIE